MCAQQLFSLSSSNPYRSPRLFIVRQHNGKKEWMPVPFLLCRLPPESVPIPALVVVVLLVVNAKQPPN
ncbi:hypothetical protein T08_7328 [Trichinella sp. T8]|nr:hypothetical protein T08_7328 [Trichinella sp. T8]